MRDAVIAIVLLGHVLIAGVLVYHGGVPRCEDVESVRIGSLVLGGC